MDPFQERKETDAPVQKLIEFNGQEIVAPLVHGLCALLTPASNLASRVCHLCLYGEKELVA